MNHGDFQRIRALFDRLADLSPELREAELARTGDFSVETRAHLRNLLQADVDLEHTTVRPAFGEAGFNAARWIGRRIGAFVLERELGRGGMGAVFLAQRVDGSVAQQAAIKLIRPDLLDEHTLARFRLERQVMAMLHHPNIAGLIDAGENEDGVPFVVMEYVEGLPILPFLREHGLGLEARLHLFLEVCDAVSHAHRNLVVHRDLKPGNILVTPEGQPKLLDFGIAKPLLARLGLVDVHETSAANRYYSPSSAAPEQVRGEATGVGCDVYALGALLYQMLCDRPPFDLSTMSAGEIERTVLETDPRLPSEQADAGQVGASLPARLLRGDLDSIVAKCLRKPVGERYLSVDQLADDVRHYLAGWPVAARRGRFGYRLRKFVGRHRTGVIASVLLLVLTVVSAQALWQQYRLIVAERNRAERVTGFLVDLFSAAGPESSLGVDISAAQVMRNAATRLENELVDQPETRMTLAAVIAQVDLALGYPADARNVLTNTRQAAQAVADDAPQQASLLEADIRTDFALGDFAAPVPKLEKLQRIAATAEDRVQAMQLAVSRLQALGQFDEAGKILREQQALVPDTADIRVLTEQRTLEAENLVGKSDSPGALRVYEALLAEQRLRLPPNHPLLLKPLENITQLHLELDEPAKSSAPIDEAMALSSKLYGPRSLYVASVLNLRGNVYLYTDQPDLAVKAQRESLEIYEAVLGHKHPSLAKQHLNLGSALETVGKDKQAALREYLTAEEIGREVYPPEHMNLLVFRAAAACLGVQIAEYATTVKMVDAVSAAAIGNQALQSSEFMPMILASRELARFAQSHTASNRSIAEESLRTMVTNLPEGTNADCGRDVLKTAHALGIAQDVSIETKEAAH